MSKIKIVVIEVPRQDDSVFQEVMSFLTEKADYQVLELPPSFYSDKQENYKLLFPGLEIRLKEQTVWRDGIEVSMSHYEFFTLVFLARHPSWVFTKEQIYEAVWQESGEYCGSAVTSVINQIRKKLNPENPRDGYIKTVIGSGYKFEVNM